MSKPLKRSYNGATDVLRLKTPDRMYALPELSVMRILTGAAFITELEQALEYIRRAPQLSVDEKKRFFKSANTNLGLTALCLSGGASFGYCTCSCLCILYTDLKYVADHFGVVKALFDAGLLPRVITGTSAGGLVAALTCTRTDDELKELLIPELADRITACEEPFRVWFPRFWKTGARFDSVLWAEKAGNTAPFLIAIFIPPSARGLLVDPSLSEKPIFEPAGS